MRSRAAQLQFVLAVLRLAPKSILLIVLTFANSALSAPMYTFTKIVDGTANAPAINNSGAVAYSRNVVNGNRGYFIADGGSVSQVYEAPAAASSLWPTFNDSGTVAFLGPTVGSPGQSIIAASIGSSISVYDTLGPIQQFSQFIQINNSGTVAFLGGVDGIGNGFFTGAGGPLTTIAVEGGSITSATGDPAINNNGAVALVGCLTISCQGAGGKGVFIGDGSSIHPILPDPTDFTFIAGLPSINDAGVVAFRGSLADGQIGLFLGDGSEVSTVAHVSGAFSDISNAFSINNAGTVAFQADLDIGGNGLFIGPDPVEDRVVGTGDLLFGSEVEWLEFWREGLNDYGDLAFVAGLTDGTVSIVVAHPIPEPSTAAMVGVALVFLAGWRSRTVAANAKATR